MVFILHITVVGAHMSVVNLPPLDLSIVAQSNHMKDMKSVNSSATQIHAPTPACSTTWCVTTVLEDCDWWKHYKRFWKDMTFVKYFLIRFYLLCPSFQSSCRIRLISPSGSLINRHRFLGSVDPLAIGPHESRQGNFLYSLPPKKYPLSRDHNFDKYMIVLT